MIWNNTLHKECIRDYTQTNSRTRTHPRTHTHTHIHAHTRTHSRPRRLSALLKCNRKQHPYSKPYSEHEQCERKTNWFKINDLRLADTSEEDVGLISRRFPSAHRPAAVLVCVAQGPERLVQRTREITRDRGRKKERERSKRNISYHLFLLSVCP